MIVLEKRTETVEIILGTKIIKQIIEIRKDPISGMYVRINTERAKRLPKEHPIEFLEKEERKRDCPFCYPFELTPQYPWGRIVVGDSVLFPNLYPFGKYHAIIVPTYRKHVENIKEISFLDFYNSLKAAVLFFKRNIEEDPEYKYCFINMNHTFSAGASKRHIHFQVFQEKEPTNYIKCLINTCKKYFEKYRRSFLEDYARYEEEAKERFIKKGRVWWFATFAPFGIYDITGIVDSFGIANMAESVFRQFVEELYNFIMEYIEKTKIISFNLMIFDPSFVKEPGLMPYIRIIGRAEPAPYYINDKGFMEVCHLEPVTTVLPEDIPKVFCKQ